MKKMIEDLFDLFFPKDIDENLQKAFDIASYAENSTLTKEQIAIAISQCKDKPLDFIGGKISLSPNEGNVEERISYITSLITIIDNVISTVKG